MLHRCKNETSHPNITQDVRLSSVFIPIIKNYSVATCIVMLKSLLSKLVHPELLLSVHNDYTVLCVFVSSSVCKVSSSVCKVSSSVCKVSSSVCKVSSSVWTISTQFILLIRELSNGAGGGPKLVSIDPF
jgi:hypothetical protein